MKKDLVAMVLKAMCFDEAIVISLESGSNSMSVSFIPEAMDEGTNGIIIYSGCNIFIINTDDVCINEFGEFVCKNKTSIVTVSPY